MYDYSTLLPDEGSQYVLDETWQAAQKVSTLRDKIMIIAAQKLQYILSVSEISIQERPDPAEIMYQLKGTNFLVDSMS